MINNGVATGELTRKEARKLKKKKREKIFKMKKLEK